MNNKNIIEWEKIDMCSNYQCKFISGEANAQKAIDIIENKFEWVAITEEYDDAVESFKTHFKLGDLYISKDAANRSRANQDYRLATKNKYADFVEEMNQEDQILYNYVKEKVWPRFKNIPTDIKIKSKTSELDRHINMMSFQIDKYLKFNKTKITKKNLIISYKIWYQK
jgi:hypothetical protein